MELARKCKCFVPRCPNSVTKTRHKLFVHVNEHLKRKWCNQLNIVYKPERRLYCCEDHLNLNEDLENYYEWKFMKAVPRLKPTAILKNTQEIIFSHGNIPTVNERRDDLITTRNESSSQLEKHVLQSIGNTTTKEPSSELKKLLLQPTGNSPLAFKRDNSSSITSSTYTDDAGANHAESDSDEETLATFGSRFKHVPAASTSAEGPPAAAGDPHDALSCDSCHTVIPWLRHVCVQCEYSQCAACEAAGRHDHHYMLRVPARSSQKVVERLVKMIQKELVQIDADSEYEFDGDPNEEPPIIQIEVKTEPEPDPLGEGGEPHQATLCTEQLTPHILEQAMLDIDVKRKDEVNDPPQLPATSSAHPAGDVPHTDDRRTSESGTGKNSTSKNGTGKNSTNKSSTGKNSTSKSGTGKNSTSKSSTDKNSTSKSGTGKNSTSKSSTDKNSTSKSGTGKNSTSKSSTGKNSTTKSGTGKNSTSKRKSSSASQARAAKKSLVTIHAGNNSNVTSLPHQTKTKRSELQSLLTQQYKSDVTRKMTETSSTRDTKGNRTNS